MLPRSVLRLAVHGACCRFLRVGGGDQTGLVLGRVWAFREKKDWVPLDDNHGETPRN